MGLSSILIPIEGWEGYFVTKSGDVWSEKGRTPRLLSKIVCHGYHTVHLSMGTVKKKRKVHQLVLEAFVGPRPEGMVGCHRDGDKTNNCLGNLRWGTHQSNSDDMKAHGTVMQGESHHKAKLNDDDVRAIRVAVGTQQEIGDRYGISQPMVGFIKRRENWQHVD